MEFENDTMNKKYIKIKVKLFFLISNEKTFDINI